jgi:hypothetical protein
MAIMAIHPASDRKGLLIAAAAAGAIGSVLIALAPTKHLKEELSGSA